MRLTLRPRQQLGVNDIRAAFRIAQSVLFVAPCAFGKTVVFAHITEGAALKGKRVLILVHRKELLLQCSRALDECGVAHGLISPDYKATTDAVQVASVQTLVRRLATIRAFDLVICDEAHHIVATTYLKIIAAIRALWPTVRILGVTATPCREDGRGLGEVFEALVMGPQPGELIASGHLSRPVYYDFDEHIESRKHRAGEFDAAADFAALDKKTIYGNVIANYKKICDGKPAIGFCVNVQHAHNTAQEMRDAGLKAAALDGTTEDKLRRGMIHDLGNGGLNVLTSCNVVTEGTDIPVVFAALEMRRTESLALKLQMNGRVMRTYPGKTHAAILDFVGNHLRHQYPEDSRIWTLDGDQQGKAKADDGPAVQRCRMCQKCYAMNPVWRTACEQCRAPFEAHRAPPKQVEGELMEVTEEQKELMRRTAKAEVARARTREELQAVAKARGYSAGWVWNIERARQRRHA